MKKRNSPAQFIRTTLVGGVIFLLPLLLVAVLLRHGFALAVKVAKPIVALLPEALVGAVVIADLTAALGLVILAFAAGMFARTDFGQRMIGWLENSLVGGMPQFNFVRGIAENVDGDDASHVDVVLVPTYAGWSLGFTFEPAPGPWQAVLVPSAPDWKSGSVVFAEAANIRTTGVGFAQAIKMHRKLGEKSDAVLARLAATPD